MARLFILTSETFLNTNRKNFSYYRKKRGNTKPSKKTVIPKRSGFPKTSVFGKTTLKFAVLQDCRKVKSLKNRKSLWLKPGRVI
jgi:hypothetical protein